MAGSSGSAAENLAIYQHGPAYAGSEGEQNHVPLSAGGAPEDLRNQRGASIVIGKDGQTCCVHHIGQKPAFQEMQVSGQAVYARSRGVNHTLAPDTDSAHRHLGSFQKGVYKVMEGGLSARRRLVKIFDQVSTKVYQRGLDCGGPNVDAHRNHLIGRRVWPALAHSRCALYALYDILVSRRWKVFCRIESWQYNTKEN